MSHKILPHEAQLLLERAKTAGAKVEALKAQLSLAEVMNSVAQTLWQQAGAAAGLQPTDQVTEDYRIRRGGAFVEEVEPPLADTAVKAEVQEV